MSVNNETGAIFDVRKVADMSARKHSDMTQSVGKIDRTVDGLDFATFNAHKLHGPKGVGALYIAQEDIRRFMLGGTQEWGRRAGTLNVPAIVGFGAACAIAADERPCDAELARLMKAVVLDELKDTDDWIENGGAEASPFILSLSFRGLEGETLTIEADRAGFAIASGAACSSGSTEPSHVLNALGLSPQWARGTVRISFGRFNNEESARSLAKILAQTAQKLRSEKR